MQEQEMLNDLIAESREHLQAIEPDLLTLEEQGDKVSDDLVNRVFRAVHSIKGGFSFFGIEPVVRLSHVMENVLSNVRDKKCAISTILVDALLKGIDKLRLLLDDVGHADTIAIDVELGNLTKFLDEKPATKVAGRPKMASNVGSDETDTSTALPEKVVGFVNRITEEIAFAALRDGRLLYEIRLNVKLDLLKNKLTPTGLFTKWEHFGEVFETDPLRQTLEDPIDSYKKLDWIAVLFSTVLEPDLIADGVGVDAEHILSIDLKPYKDKWREQKNALATGPVATTSAATVTETRAATVTAEDSLRVKVELLNKLMNFAGELVLSRNQLLQVLTRKFSETPEAKRIVTTSIDEIRKSLVSLRSNGSTAQKGDQEALNAELARLEKKLFEILNFSVSSCAGINAVAQNIDLVTTVLQENIMQTRLQPMSVVFSKFPRVIRDLSQKVKKEIGLTLIGQEVELDKSIIELLSDPLTHLIRNCADHGIESPDARAAAGKPRKGEVILRAFQEGGKVIIEVKDDGAGIDPKKVADKAIEKGLLTKEKIADMTERELQMLIFLPGFSTAAVVSDVSGRGVGMDVVKTNIERLGGTVDILSNKGSGTCVTMKMPLTLAIIPSLLVETDDRRFAIPQMGLEEIVRIRAADVTKTIERIKNSEVLRLRNKLLPLVRLADVLGIEPKIKHPETGELIPDKRTRWSDRRNKPIDENETPESRAAGAALAKERRESGNDRRTNVANAVKIIVLRLEKNLFGLVVDNVLDSEEIVVKPLPDALKASQCYAGATIMGDGKVAMILDPAGIAALANLHFDDLDKEIEREEERARLAAKKHLQNILLFSIGGSERFATDLADIARIEKHEAGEIEIVGDKEFLKHGESTLQLYRLDRFMSVSGAAAEQPFVIVPKNSPRPVGIMVAAVEDTISMELKIDKESIHGTGIMGSSVINNKLTLVVNLGDIVNAAVSS